MTGSVAIIMKQVGSWGWYGGKEPYQRKWRFWFCLYQWCAV